VKHSAALDSKPLIFNIVSYMPRSISFEYFFLLNEITLFFKNTYKNLLFSVSFH